MDQLPAAVSLITEAMLVSARWASQRRRLYLEQAPAVADHSRVMELQARVACPCYIGLGQRKSAQAGMSACEGEALGAPVMP